MYTLLWMVHFVILNRAAENILLNPKEDSIIQECKNTTVGFLFFFFK